MSPRKLRATFVALLLTCCSLSAAGEKYKGFVRGESLISVVELKQLIDREASKVVVLAVVEPMSFMTGHIPTSINVWRPDYEQEVTRHNPIEGMLLTREAFQTFARRLGIDNNSVIVVYDEKYDAPRLWWAFYFYGKTDVKVLDGGYPAWKAAGYDTDASLTRGGVKKNGTFVAKERPSGWFARTKHVWQGHASANVRVWDAREREEWTGQERKGNARRAGHIPWAQFQNWREYRELVQGKPTAFKSASEVQHLIERYGMDPKDQHIFYCHSGVRSATAVFVLYLMGWDPDRLYNYDGSWLEWAHDDQNPVAAAQ